MLLVYGQIILFFVASLCFAKNVIREYKEGSYLFSFVSLVLSVMFAVVVYKYLDVYSII